MTVWGTPITSLYFVSSSNRTYTIRQNMRNIDTNYYVLTEQCCIYQSLVKDVPNGLQPSCKIKFVFMFLCFSASCLCTSPNLFGLDVILMLHYVTI